MAIGYKPGRKKREPVYSSASIKVGYLEGSWFTDLQGRKIARITKYHVELPAANSSCSGSHVVTPDSTYEG